MLDSLRFIDLPTKPEDLTRLNDLVEAVTNFELKSTCSGTASKVFGTLTYKDTSGELVKKRVCIKGGFSEEMMGSQYRDILVSMYNQEGKFFVEKAPSIEGIMLPNVLWVLFGTEPDQCIIIMEDLKEKGCTFGEPSEPWTCEEVKNGVEQLAILHARTWAQQKLDDSPLYEKVMIGLTNNWDNVVLGPGRPKVADILKDKSRVVAAMEKHFRTKNPKYRCLIHGDPHSGNTFFLDGKPGFLDWQTYNSGSPFHDFAYFMVGALSPDDRRLHEFEILEHYLRALEMHGGPSFTAQDEEVIREYKKSIMAGMGWILTPYEMQRIDRVFAMVDRYSQAFTDHKVIELVESLPTLEEMPEHDNPGQNMRQRIMMFLGSIPSTVLSYLSWGRSYMSYVLPHRNKKRHHMTGKPFDEEARRLDSLC